MGCEFCNNREGKVEGSQRFKFTLSVNKEGHLYTEFDNLENKGSMGYRAVYPIRYCPYCGRDFFSTEESV